MTTTPNARAKRFSSYGRRFTVGQLVRVANSDSGITWVVEGPLPDTHGRGMGHNLVEVYREDRPGMINVFRGTELVSA